MNKLAAIMLALGIGCYSARPAECPELLDDSVLRISINLRNGVNIRYVDETTKSGLRCRYEFEYGFLDDKPSNDIHAVMSTAGELEQVMIGGVSLPPDGVRTTAEQEQWVAVQNAFVAVMAEYGPVLSVFNRCDD
ncbi:MAG: hypothetical protein KKD17_00250 [Nanoarchaeota archaeon]|nr:hypothetical protein [Nanoarchaeota archaeon]